MVKITATLQEWFVLRSAMTAMAEVMDESSDSESKLVGKAARIIEHGLDVAIGTRSEPRLSDRSQPGDVVTVDVNEVLICTAWKNLNRLRDPGSPKAIDDAWIRFAAELVAAGVYQ